MLGPTAILVVIIVVCIFASEPLFKRASSSAFLAARHGRVVDATSGVGIGNAVVFHKWLLYGGCGVEKATVTDSNGSFALPGAGGDFEFPRTWLGNIVGAFLPIRIRQPNYQTQMWVYKAGYVPAVHVDERVLPASPSAEVILRLQAQPAPSNELRRYDAVLLQHLGCAPEPYLLGFPRLRRVTKDGKTSNERYVAYLCDGKPVASAEACLYKNDSDWMTRIRGELAAGSWANRAGPR